MNGREDQLHETIGRLAFRLAIAERDVEQLRSQLRRSQAREQYLQTLVPAGVLKENPGDC